MSTRRTHTKSRNGCTNCKRRKIKCDEVYPSCFNCRRHGTTCSLGLLYHSAAVAVAAEAGLPASPATTSSLPHNGLDNSVVYSPHSSPASKYAYLNVLAAGGGGPGVDYYPSPALPLPPGSLAQNGAEFELVHHFCTVTVDTLSLREDVRQVWRAVVPREGYQHGFVRDGVLAAAALHRAFLLPANASRRRAYADLAAHHQATGLQGFRSAVAHVTADNWRPVFCFAVLVILYVYALPPGVQQQQQQQQQRSSSLSPSDLEGADGQAQEEPEEEEMTSHRLQQQRQRLGTPVRAVMELFSVVRGLHFIMKPYMDTLRTTEFGPIVLSVASYDGDDRRYVVGEAMSQSQSQSQPQSTQQQQQQQQQHRGCFDLMRSNSAPSLEHSPLPEDTFSALHSLRSFFQAEAPRDKVQHYDYAVDGLRLSARLIGNAGILAEASLLMFWPCFLHETVLDDIQSLNPCALVLLAYFSVFMKVPEKIHWLTRGWSRPLLEDVERHLSNQSQYLAWLQWPKSHVQPYPYTSR